MRSLCDVVTIYTCIGCRCRKKSKRLDMDTRSERVAVYLCLGVRAPRINRYAATTRCIHSWRQETLKDELGISFYMGWWFLNKPLRLANETQPDSLERQTLMRVRLW